MQHNIPVDILAPLGEEIAQAVGKCVHCGFCLPTCPTYRVLNDEMDSPRGRIILMKSVLENRVDLDDALPYIDRCLGCLSCETACPSGVSYNELITPFKAYAAEHRKRSFSDQIAHRLILETIPYPSRFRSAARAGKFVKPLADLLPDKFSVMINMIPDSLPEQEDLSKNYPADVETRGRISLQTGCIQRTLEPEINLATIRVLVKNGIEVHIPPEQGCCGAIAIHTGDIELARKLAANNLQAFYQEVDAIITNAAGCGSGMKEYSLIFKGTPLEDEAIRFEGLVQDISVYLWRLGIVTPPTLSKPMKVAYHDACHLAHAQRVISEPRQLLSEIGNLTVINLAESDLCCGSAGTYNLEQPQTAQLLGKRKINHIIEAGVDAVVTGNIGCMVQLSTNIAAAGYRIPVLHTIQVLDRAYMDGI